MARSIDYRSVSQYSADEIYATMVDLDYLHARLAKLGGPGAELVEHRADADSARYRLRHGLSSADLPPIVGSLLNGDIVIERTETLQRKEAGLYLGEVKVVIRGTPASASGGTHLADRADGSELRIRADVTVAVPLFGGKIEGVIAEQIKKLIDKETRFTLDWIATHSS